jgi:ATP-binding cassette, subfamily B (MDR/TAP), member 1
MKALFAQPIAKLDMVSAGTVSNTITSSANAIQVSISDRLVYLFQGLALIIAAYAVAFSYSWSLTLVASSAIIFILVVYSVTTPYALKAQAVVDKSDEKHATIAGEIFSSIRTVFSLGAEKSLSDRYITAVNESERAMAKMAPWYGIQLGPAFFALYSAFALSFWVGLKFYAQGIIPNVNSVVITFFSVLIIVSILGSIVQPIMNIFKAISASTSFFEIIDAEKPDVSGMSGPDVSSHEDVELRGVTFAYPSRPSVQVLKGLDVRFEKGKTTAIVGPSGSGKSTIVGLLQRWYSLDDNIPTEKPTTPSEAGASASVQNSGSVLCGQHNINTFDLKWWRSQVGLVQQEPFLFNDSIVANVSFGLLGTQWETCTAEEKLELVKSACKEAFADEFVEKLPKGYDTIVGESGIKLSGGQRQRLAIARSIIRRPAILVLDEATSAIDVRSEAIVQKALDRVSKDRTTIVIAHRLATIQKADHIIVLRHGTKAEEGTHDELLKLEDGVYSGLVHAQRIQEDAADNDVDEAATSNPELLRKQTTAAQSFVMPDAQLESSSYKAIGFLQTIGSTIAGQKVRWYLLVLVIIGAMGAGASFALQSWYFAKLIEVFTFTGQRLADQRDFWSLMFFILAIANALCYQALGHSSGILQSHATSSARRDYFTNMIRQPIPFFDGEENSSGSVMAKLNTNPKTLGEILGLNGSFPSISIFNVVSCIIISFYFGWKLTVVVLFSAMPILLICQFFKVRNEYYYDQMSAKVFAGSSSFATEAVGAIRTVSSLTMEDTIIEKYSNLLSEQVAKSARRATWAMLISAFCDSCELAAVALAFWYGGRLLGTREYNPTQFFVIYVAIIQGSLAAGQFFSGAPSIARATQAANEIRKLRTLNLVNEDENNDNLDQLNSNLGAAINISDVAFTYPTRDVPLFKNLCVNIPAGSFAAFVGPSGCGKTSVVSLLERFYEPLAGTITFNNIPINSIPVKTYRKHISLVAQEPRLFSGSIRENLVLSMDDPTAVPDEQIHQACRDAEIHDFIISLPEGYNTQLGQSSNTALSGGQKQRLCLARALLRRPKLLLLDEATSSLDSQSEKLVQQAIERLVGSGREMTVIAVAHRLATVQKADVIFVFGESEKGSGARIVEHGSHGELMRRRGAYYQMVMAQALDR